MFHQRIHGSVGSYVEEVDAVASLGIGVDVEVWECGAAVASFGETPVEEQSRLPLLSPHVGLGVSVEVATEVSAWPIAKDFQGVVEADGVHAGEGTRNGEDLTHHRLVRLRHVGRLHDPLLRIRLLLPRIRVVRMHLLQSSYASFLPLYGSKLTSHLEIVGAIDGGNEAVG